MCRGVIARLMSMPPKVAQAGLIPALYQATQITYLPRSRKGFWKCVCNRWLSICV